MPPQVPTEVPAEAGRSRTDEHLERLADGHGAVAVRYLVEADGAHVTGTVDQGRSHEVLPSADVEERPADSPGAAVASSGTIQKTGDDTGVGVPADPGNGRPSQRVRRRRSVVGVDNRNEVRDFLSSRRARITPEQAGLPTYGNKRRVPGLRREEVALLAGVSVDYYVRLERGNLNGVSESVLEALARALQLDEAERAHLFDLARTANTPVRPPRRTGQQRVRPSVQWILDAMTGAPAYVRTGCVDVLGANRLGYALYSPVLDGRQLPVNLARFLFLDPRATEFYVDWEKAANDAVAILRSETGRDPYDRNLSNLIGELSTRSEPFRIRWAAHNVRLHRTGSSGIATRSSETLS
jgi:transcriptional regulator with XRE-family HTH domain